MSYHWQLVFTPEASRELASMDRPVSERLVEYLEERVLPLEDPRTLGRALIGPEWRGCWRYRCGDYRIIVRILDEDVIVLVLRAGHRKNVY